MSKELRMDTVDVMRVLRAVEEMREAIKGTGFVLEIDTEFGFFDFRNATTGAHYSVPDIDVALEVARTIRRIHENTEVADCRFLRIFAGLWSGTAPLAL